MAYLTPAEADIVIQQLFMSSSQEVSYWNSLSNEDKQVVINTGSDLIEGCLFRGHRDLKSTAAFPRYIDHVYFGTPPQDVLKAIVVLGIKKGMQEGKKETQLKEMGVSSYRVADASISFSSDAKSNMRNNIPLEIYNRYIRKYCY